MNLVVEVETLAVREGIRMLEDMNIRGNIVVRTGSLATVELLRASKIRNRTVSNRTKRIAQMWGKDKKIGVVWVMKGTETGNKMADACAAEEEKTV